MNGKVSKRIRLVARCLSSPGKAYRAKVAQLKAEYLHAPYHQRATLFVESHSVVLKRHHKGEVRPWL